MTARRSGTVLLVLGVVFVAVGLLMNEWWLVRFSMDGAFIIDTKLKIWTLQLVAIVGGLILVVYRRRPRLILPVCILLLGTACTATLLTEMLLRTVEADVHRWERVTYQRYYPNHHALTEYTKFFKFDPVLGWVGTPDSVVMHKAIDNDWQTRFLYDAEGYRQLPHLASKYASDAPTRVLLLGDSAGFSMGASDEETIDHFLLNGGRRMALKNVSQPGYSPEQYYEAYLKYREAFRPTTAYMLLLHANDFWIMQNCTAFSRFKPTVRLWNGVAERVVTPAEMQSYKPSSESLVWDSRLVYGIASFLEPLSLKRLCGVDEPYGMQGNYWTERLKLYSASLNANGAFDHIWKRFDFIVGRWQADAVARGINFKILIMPLHDFAAIAEGSRGTGSERRPFTAIGDESVEVVKQQIRKIADKYHVAVLDPQQPFDDANRAGLPTYSPEGHYGPVGNKIVADAILQDLAKEPAVR